MSRWPVQRLGDVAELNPGQHGWPAVSEDQPVSFVPMANVCERLGVITALEERRFAEVSEGYTLFWNGDVLFAKITPCMENGKAAIVEGLPSGLGAGSTEFFVIRAKALVLPRFLYWFVRRTSFREQCRASFTGTAGQQRVPRSFLENVKIPLPPLEEQRRIVAVLDRAASLRRRIEAARAKARALIPALFLETFGDPATNPKSWPVVLLEQCADVQGGLQVTSKRSVMPLEAPYLRVANVLRGRLDLAEIKTIRLTQSELDRTALQAGDLLLVEGHGNASEVGRAAVWRDEIGTCVHQNHLIRVRPRQDCLTSEYLVEFLNSESGRLILIGSGKTTSGLNTISTGNVRTVRLPLPPLPLQKAFAEQVARIEALARRLDTAAAHADQLAASLSAQFFDEQREVQGPRTAAGQPDRC